MSLIPNFKIGIWNAWILMVLIYAASFIPLYIDKDKMEKRGEGEPGWSQLNRNTKITFIITHMIIMPFTLIYSIFLPLKPGAIWFYAGLVIYLFGWVLVLLTGISFSTAPLGVPMTKGVYAISRNPGYFGLFLGYIGTGIACTSWVFFLCALVWIIAWNYGVIEEERIMIEKYGDAYEQYMKQTPRWIGLPKNR
ncbi:MAG: methyltransferase [Anaerolineales bacterium]|jgi:protein-S-isoprenylcysteine O-methyltransferase Ste14